MSDFTRRQWLGGATLAGAVAAARTALMPGAGPPPTRIASVLAMPSSVQRGPGRRGGI